MKCKEAKELLVAFHQQELSETDAAELERHVSACENCARELKYLGWVDMALDGEELAEPPAGLVERILSRLPVEGVQESVVAADRVSILTHVGRSLAWPVVSALAVLLCILLLGQVNGHDAAYGFSTAMVNDIAGAVRMLGRHVWLVTALVIVYVLFDLCASLVPIMSREKS